jgi:hypothetical protein
MFWKKSFTMLLGQNPSRPNLPFFFSFPTRSRRPVLFSSMASALFPFHCMAQSPFHHMQPNYCPNPAPVTRRLTRVNPGNSDHTWCSSPTEESFPFLISSCKLRFEVRLWIKWVELLALYGMVLKALYIAALCLIILIRNELTLEP